MSIENLLDQVAKLGNTLGSANNNANGLSDGIQSIVRPVEELSNVIGALGGQLAVFDKLTAASLTSKNSIQDLDSAVRAFREMSADPLFGDGIISTAFIDALSGVNDIIQSTARATSQLDDSSRTLREYSQATARIGRTFGMTYEESMKLRDGISELAASMENADLYLTFDQVRKGAQTMMKMGIEAKYLDDAVTTLTNSFNFVESSIFLARATGQSTSEVFRDMKKRIYEFGMSADEATTQVGTFYDMSQKTGLDMSTVASALEGAASSFKNLGLSSDFAKPLLEGFVRTLEKVGLGIGNATGLAQTMSRSIMALASDYGKAFFTMQQGGLDFGAGGGVFGSSIGLRMKLLEAEKVGGDQAEIGLDIAKSIRATLENFGGGEIVSLEDAYNSPEKQSMYVMQQELLKNYGISDQGAMDRTLELLKEIDGISALSNEETKAKLEELVDTTKVEKESTLDEAQKTNAHLSKMIAQNTIANTTYVGMLEMLKSISIATGGMTRGQITDMSYALDQARKDMSENMPTEGDVSKKFREISMEISKIGNEQRTPESNQGGALRRQVKIVLDLTDRAQQYLQKSEEVTDAVDPTPQ